MSFIGGSMDTFVPYIYVMSCSASRVPLLLRAANALTLTWCSYTVSEQRFADRASATCPYLRVACFYSSRKLRRALHPRYQGNASLGSSRVVDAECHWRHELSAFTDRFSERYGFPRMVSNSWCCVQNTASDSCEVNVEWNMVYLYQCDPVCTCQVTGPTDYIKISYGWLGSPEKDTPSDVRYICNRIKKAISGHSEVFFPPAPQYFSDISHASSSSSQVSTCSVEPGSVEDVSKILNILGSSRTPFAVKGGGHSTNPGFSSTSGVQISMSRFNHTKVNVAEETVEISAGLTWDQVYVALNSTGVNVVGGRVSGVGVAGLTLGGGYSFKTSQYGLTVDNVVGYELVLPNGTFINVTPNDSDLWFALRGGLNNFGIVTKFILKSHPQGDIWGGLLFYAENQLDAIKKALINFQQKNDTQAALLVALAYSSNQLTVVVFVFYDAPTHGGVFDEFLAIPTTQGAVHTRSFSDFVFSEGTVVPDGLRTFYCDAPVTQYSSAVFDAFVNQTKFWGTRLSALDGNVTVSSTLEPLDNDYFSHGSGSAYPPDRSHAIFHSIMSTVWTNASLDEEMAHALRQGSAAVRAAALADGQDVSHAAAYVNYALFDTPLEDIYGGNVERLREIRAVVDPKDVMGLAGGFKF